MKKNIAAGVLVAGLMLPEELDIILEIPKIIIKCSHKLYDEKAAGLKSAYTGKFFDGLPIVDEVRRYSGEVYKPNAQFQFINWKPDHIGCLNVFMEGIVREEIASQINQDQALLKQLNSLREEIIDQYLLPLIKGIKKAADKNIQLPFLREILNFYTEFIEKDVAMLKH